MLILWLCGGIENIFLSKPCMTAIILVFESIHYSFIFNLLSGDNDFTWTGRFFLGLTGQ